MGRSLVVISKTILIVTAAIAISTGGIVRSESRDTSGSLAPKLTGPVSSGTDRAALLVRLDAGADRIAFRRAVGSHGGRVRYEYRLLRDLVAIRDFPRSAIGQLADFRGVAEVRTDRRVRGHLSESVPLIRADATSMSGYSDGSGVVVCVLDTGIDKSHPAFSGALTAERDFVNSDGDAQDDEGHGTHVAGIVLSRDATYPGVAPGASLAAGKVLDQNRSGYDSDIIAGIEWCTLDVGADVVNLSLGGDAWPGSCDFDALAEEVNASVDQGVVHVIASGNESELHAVDTPACARRAISVGAVYDADVGSMTHPGCVDPVTAPDLIACYSNGSAALDMVAPGSVITTADLGGGFDSYDGTSMAAPHVAGLAARLIGEHPEYGPVDVQRVLARHAVDLDVPGFDDRHGHGRIDALRALGEPLPITCGADPECDDLDVCTTDRCRGGYCERLSLCDDGDACTEDVCTAGLCDHPAVDIDDDLPCTTDSCDSCLGAIHTPTSTTCHGSCTVAIPVPVGMTVSGDTTGNSALYDAPCGTENSPTGPEVVYRVHLDSLEPYRVRLDSDFNAAVYLLMESAAGGDCDPDRCLTGADRNDGPGFEVVPAFLPPVGGEYYMVVDSTDGTVGPFTLVVERACYPEEQGRPCDDHNACTIDDTCQGGVCAAPGPGQVPDGANLRGTPLTILKSDAEPGNIKLSWGTSCGTGATDYSIHEGDIPSWYTHTFKTCSSSGELNATIEPGDGDHYYVVVPVDAVHEGSYGRDSDGNLRPPSIEPCRALMLPEPCP